VDFRGARRVVGKVIGLSVIEVKKSRSREMAPSRSKRPRRTVQEYELEQHVENNGVAIGDTISLRRGAPEVGHQLMGCFHV